MDMDRDQVAYDGEEVDVDTFAFSNGEEVDVDTFDAAEASGDDIEQPLLGNGGDDEVADEKPKLKDPPPEPSMTVDEELATDEENGTDPSPQDSPAANGNDGKPGDKVEDGDAFEDEEDGGKSKKSSKKKREINPDFKDVKETGKWGKISKGEMIAVGVVLLLMIIGGIVGVVYAVVIKDEDTTTELIERNTVPPTAAPTPMPPAEKLEIIRSSIGSSNVTADLLDGLPDDIEFYVDKGAAEDGACAAGESHLCAMHWLLYGDDFSPEEDVLVTRYALASLYYSWSGRDWFNNTNWVTGASYCEWYGVKCSRVGSSLTELDLAQNNVMGEIPEEMILLQTIESMSFKENTVSGPLPGYIFASLPSLFVLYAQENSLSGPIPTNLRDNGTLSLLFLHGNNFTGPYPSNYCLEVPEGMTGWVGSVFREWSVDCDENFCPESCCESLNCY